MNRRMDYKYTVEFLDDSGRVTHEKHYKNIKGITHDLFLTYGEVKAINAHSEGIFIGRIYNPISKMHSIAKKYRITSLRHTINILLEKLMQK